MLKQRSVLHQKHLARGTRAGPAMGMKAVGSKLQSKASSSRSVSSAATTPSGCPCASTRRIKRHAKRSGSSASGKADPLSGPG